MKLLALAVLACFVAAFAGAQTDTSSAVEASKSAKEKRKKSSTKVITNKDVKKSKGKLVENTAATTPVPPAPESEIAKHEAAKKARLENETKRAEAEKKVAELERELARIEQSYYEENDLNRRDTEIAKRFEDVKKQLDEARKQLSAVSSQLADPTTPES